MTTKKHLLIALDNNPGTTQSLAYCAMLFKCDPDVTFHLIHCIDQSKETIVPEPADPESSLLPGLDVNKTQKRHAERILAKGSDYLLQQGVSPKKIITTLVPSGNKTPQTIMLEAEKLLSDCIVIARRGIGYVGEMIMGSVSATLFRNLHSSPLWVIDGEVHLKNILVAVDGSIHSLRAIDHLAHILENRSDISIYLYHCAAFLAPVVVCSLENFYKEWDVSWCDTHLSGKGCLFNGPARLLLEAGIPEENIIILPETKHLEESSSIISQAEKHECGTIVVGRRGPDVRKGFFGGVSNKTIRQTQNMAVWVIG